MGKLITVTSSGGPSVTIIDGGSKAPVVIFDTNETASSVLNGFTLQNGLADSSFPGWGSGGGILIYYASPVITNNVIRGNRAGGGLGIEIQGGSAVIRANTITGNTAGGASCCTNGGGIEVIGDDSHPPATPQIVGNTITNNNLSNGGGGGGISAAYFASPTIQNNYIAGNSVYNNGGGINLESYNSPLVLQNIIVNNSAGAGGSGGGIYVQGPAEATDVIVNNTIVGNTSAFGGSSGIYTNYFAATTISNNIVVAATGQNAIVCDPNFPTPTFSHNDIIVSNGGQAWSANCASFAQTNGNILADPQFVDAANGNYHLQAGSPAIDAGDNAAPNLPPQDYDGHPRLLDGKNDCISTVDIGAYELQPGAANVSFSAGSLSFFSQLIGTTSNPQSVTLTNTGGACFQFAGSQITGDFSQSGTCAAPGLKGGSSCVYGVSFTPAASGLRTGALTVSGSDGVTSSTPTVSLSGIGLTPPAVALSTASLTFGPQVLGTQSTPQTITLTNTGQASLSISSINVSSPFSETFTCPGLLAGGASCTISVVYTALIAGTQPSTLTITDNASGSPQVVSLTGTAVDFSITASPLSATVKHGQAAQFSIGVIPKGGPFASSVSLSCSGQPLFSTCNFSPSSVVPGPSGTASTLTLSTSGKTPRGTFQISVVGQSGSLQHSATITLTVK
jgi:hypothetical protein